MLALDHSASMHGHYRQQKMVFQPIQGSLPGESSGQRPSHHEPLSPQGSGPSRDWLTCWAPLQYGIYRLPVRMPFGISARFFPEEVQNIPWHLYPWQQTYNSGSAWTEKYSDWYQNPCLLALPLSYGSGRWRATGYLQKSCWSWHSPGLYGSF